MAMFQITCVDLPAGKAAHADILGFGGEAWHASREAVVDDIEQGRNTYYVRKEGRNFLVSIEVGAAGRLPRTREDGRWTDLLLELPACAALKTA